jgi:hypothetical protein
VRLASNGTRRTTFGNNGEVLIPNVDELRDVVVQPNNKILAAGSAGGDAVVVRINGDGSLDSTFATNGVFRSALTGTLEVRGLTLDAHGRIALVAIRNTNTALAARLR